MSTIIPQDLDIKKSILKIEEQGIYCVWQINDILYIKQVSLL